MCLIALIVCDCMVYPDPKLLIHFNYISIIDKCLTEKSIQISKYVPVWVWIDFLCADMTRKVAFKQFF